MRAENDTLVYGSNDYGQHVWAMNERFNKIMAVAGRKLKLKGAFQLSSIADHLQSTHYLFVIIQGMWLASLKKRTNKSLFMVLPTLRVRLQFVFSIEFS